MTIELDNVRAEIFRFSNGTEVTEYHLMLHVTDTSASFPRQLESLLRAYDTLRAGHLEGAVAVFKRYFLSDAANQADEVIAADGSDCALSLIQQPPLDGTKLALWAYMQTGVLPQATGSGLYETRHGQFRHLWSGGSHALAEGSEAQTSLVINQYVMQLFQEDCSLAANCIRTWFFVNDIDNNYAGVVKARNDIFYTQGLTPDTHFIASTGIGGRQADHRVLSQMDAYAIAGLQPGQVTYLYAPGHLNRTSEYGVSFERGTRVDYADRRHVFISGTASIDNKGQILHRGDIAAQTRRMWENVEALLAEAGCTYDDVAQMIVYLRDTADYPVVRKLYAERFPDKPAVFVLAPVCRPGWLIEMECMAVKAGDNPALPAY
ncbi:MAG: hypothetical protein IJ659_07915 [Alloprevotella sp.]|nr:hypothetical protein [Alloprevotella sp.]